MSAPFCPLQVSQGNVPGVESASLAMDTEEGVEVVWNEVLFSDKKVFKAQEVAWLFVPKVNTQCIYLNLLPLLLFYIMYKTCFFQHNKGQFVFRY